MADTRVATLIQVMDVIRKGVELDARPHRIAFALAYSGLLKDWERQEGDPYEVPFGDTESDDAFDAEAS